MPLARMILQASGFHLFFIVSLVGRNDEEQKKGKYLAAAGYETFVGEYTSVKATSYTKGGCP